METAKSQCILPIWAGSRSAFSRKLLLCDADCAIFLLSVAVAEGVFLYRTESRNALLAVITFAVLLCFRPRRRRKAGFSRGFLGLMSVAPLLFAGLYMRVVDAPFFARFFSFATAEGKELNSRTDIWEPAFRLAFRIAYRENRLDFCAPVGYNKGIPKALHPKEAFHEHYGRQAAARAG